MTQDQGQALMQFAQSQLAATNAIGILLTSAVFWLQCLAWLCVPIIFLLALRRFGK